MGEMDFADTATVPPGDREAILNPGLHMLQWGGAEEGQAPDIQLPECIATYSVIRMTIALCGLTLPKYLK
jgi:hypothetical protein